MKNAVAPIALQIQPTWVQYVSVRLTGERITTTMQAIERVWDDLSVSRSLDFFFLDEEYDNLYCIETRIGSVINSFTILAIVIGCLGLFGLALLTVTRRLKEIGIRKVLGASIAF